MSIGYLRVEFMNFNRNIYPWDQVKSLEKYIEPLRRMILRIGNEDNEKLLKGLSHLIL